MSISGQRIHRGAGALVVMVCLLWCAGAQAGQRVVLGPADGLLLGQPEVMIGLEDPANPDVLVGPLYDNIFVLDTAANGILFAERSYWSDLQASDPNMYEVEQVGGEDVAYVEQGIAGTDNMDVFVPYNVYIAGTDGSGEFLAGQLRSFGNPNIGLGDIAGLAGMPVMINHNVHVNLHNLINPDANFEMSTAFDATPVPVASTYTVSLERLAAEHTGQQNAGDPLPDFADIPYVPNTRFTSSTASVSVDAIVDTGAQLSIIGRDTALSLGIDPDTDAVDYTQVGGIGGEATVPIVHVGEMAIPTAAGIDLVFTEMDMVVLDVAGIDAIIGMDALTGGYLEPVINAVFAWALNEPIPDDYGYFSDVVFDFVGEQWTMRLDVNPAYNVITYDAAALLGDANNDGVVSADDFAAVQSNFGATGDASGFLLGDANDDGVVSADDFAAIQAHFGSVQSTSTNTIPVPEPATIALLTLGGVALLKRRR